MAFAQSRSPGHWCARNWTNTSGSLSWRVSRKPMRISKTNSINFSKNLKYGAIYPDPPWSFRNWSAKGTGRNAVSHYDCLDFPKLAALPVADLAANDCALFLWAVDPLLPRAFELIEAWGFEYKTVA